MCTLHKIKPELVPEELIEAHVRQLHYPVYECLQICRDFDQKKAIAALLEREQKYLEAIETIMSYVSSISLVSITKEILEIVTNDL